MVGLESYADDSVNENFNTVFNLSPLGMCIVSLTDERFVDVNEVFLQVSGLAREQALQIHAGDPLIWVNHDEYQIFKKRVALQRYTRNYEARIRIKGMTKTMLLSAAVIWWHNQACILVVINDITELKQYKQEMSRLDRLNLVGEMAAGIAHEVRNPMTTVKGFLQLMRSDTRYDEDFANMDLMIEELDRANGIITEFLSLARNKAVNLVRGDINTRLLKMHPLLQAEATKKDIKIDMVLQKTQAIMMDEADLRQLVLNLVINGMDAMLQGGTLTIRTYEDKYGVNLIIEDQGTGIPVDLVEHLGKPFFTTKEKGTGLGLAVCCRIVERHNAYMEFDSSTKGTAFTIIFPKFQEVL
ncbi:MAG: PAS domain S-box protein [Syntrophomonadaceae bacterium]|nr:PAS domain S-box protein [Syntrophomonadaceae bacterium]